MDCLRVGVALIHEMFTNLFFARTIPSFFLSEHFRLTCLSLIKSLYPVDIDESTPFLRYWSLISLNIPSASIAAIIPSHSPT